jgi:hypothetical protein
MDQRVAGSVKQSEQMVQGIFHELENILHCYFMVQGNNTADAEKIAGGVMKSIVEIDGKIRFDLSSLVENGEVVSIANKSGTATIWYGEQMVASLSE